MGRLPEPDRPRPGLRARKKARTRAAIQDHALRLFSERGYEQTTIDEIAEAAEVSPSTFFRYFRTKEDVVLYDDLDPVMFAGLAAQPADLSPIGAVRAAIREVFGAASPGALARQEERAALIFSVPELRMRMLDEVIRSIHELAAVIARRAGRADDDPAARTVAGAAVGAVIAAWITADGRMRPDYLALMDEALDQLERGLKL